MIFIILLLAVLIIFLVVRSSKQNEKYDSYVPPPKEEYRYVETKIPNAERTKEGWVYVLSNLGSFGEGIYKVGMTRRDDPQKRVNELGDASVPFPFDVHAMIWTEDAPELESKLHKDLKKYMYNKVNTRKEFFKVDLETIRDLVPDEEFSMEHPAAQYYKSHPKTDIS